MVSWMRLGIESWALREEVGIMDSGKGHQCIQGSTDMGSFMGSNEQFKAHWRCHNSLSVCQSARYQYFTPILAILWHFGCSWVTLRRPGAILPVIFSVGDFQPLMCGWCGVMELCIGPNLGLRMLILVTENDSKPIQRHCFPKKRKTGKISFFALLKNFSQ